MELPRDYLIQPVAMFRNAGRDLVGLPVAIKSEQRSQSRRNAGRNRPEYATTMVLWLPAVAWKKLTTEQKDSIRSYVKTSYPNAKCGIGIGRVDGVDITSDEIIPIN